MPLLINCPTGAKWVGRFLKRINKLGHGVPVEAPLGENLYRLCKSMMRSFWNSVLLKDWTNPRDFAKKTNVPGIRQMPKVQRERTGCWRTRAMRRLRWNFVVDKRQGHGRSGLFARVKRKPASRSRIGSATQSQFCLSIT